MRLLAPLLLLLVALPATAQNGTGYLDETFDASAIDDLFVDLSAEDVIVEALDGSGRLGSRSQRDGALHFNVTEAGRYRLEIPEINGFDPHPPIELDLVAGELTEHTIELVRRR